MEKEEGLGQKKKQAHTNDEVHRPERKWNETAQGAIEGKKTRKRIKVNV